MSTPGTESSWQSHRGKKAAYTRWRGTDYADTTRAAREFAAARWESHIQQLVDEAPPLTAEQRDRIAVLLRPALQNKGADSA